MERPDKDRLQSKHRGERAQPGAERQPAEPEPTDEQQREHRVCDAETTGVGENQSWVEHRDDPLLHDQHGNRGGRDERDPDVARCRPRDGSEQVVDDEQPRSQGNRRNFERIEVPHR